MSWYLKEIDKCSRRTSRGVGLVDFTDELVTRFKMSIAKAMDRVYTVKYSLNDVAKEREPQSYSQNI